MFNETEVVNNFLDFHKSTNKIERGKILGNIIQEIRKQPIVQFGYSSKEIKSSVNYILNCSTTLDENKKEDYIRNSVTKLNKEFSSNLGTWNFIVSIENLKLNLRSLNVGDVKFFKFTENRRKEMRARIWKILRNNPHYDFNWKKKYVNSHDERTYKPLVGKTCALVEIKGRLDIAQLEANDKIETAISILKLYRTWLYDSHANYFHITGKVIPKTIRITIRYTADGKNLNPNMEWVGCFFPFEINAEKLEFMKKAGFSRLHQMFKKKNYDGLDKRILNTIRLFGSACNIIVIKSKNSYPIGLGFPSEDNSEPQTSFESIALNERLVSLFIALESLLIFGENEPLSNNIAERSAFILADTYNNRLFIKRFIKTMYRFRSSHVHHGKSRLNHKLLEKFTYYVQAIISKVIFLKISKSFQSETDLKNWFEMKKLS